MVEFIIAAVFVLILAACAFVGVKKGFIRMIAGFVEYIISFFVAYVFCTKLAVVVEQLPFLKKMITAVEMPEFEKGAGFSEKTKAVLDYLGDALTAGEDVGEKTKAVMSNYLADIIATVLAFIALFIVTLLVLKLLVFIIDKAMKAPVLNGTNKVLGFLFGLFCGSFWTWLIATVFAKLLPFLSDRFPSVFSEVIADSPVMIFFLKINPISLFLSALTWIADKFTV